MIITLFIPENEYVSYYVYGVHAGISMSFSQVKGHVSIFPLYFKFLLSVRQSSQAFIDALFVTKNKALEFLKFKKIM